MAPGAGVARTPRALGLDPRLEASGFNTAGVLEARRYDALVPPAWRSTTLLPGARAAAVLGCGGRAFGAALNASRSSPEQDADPVDGFTTRVVEHAAGLLRDAGEDACALFYWEQRDGGFADFSALGHACGLGVPSRLGILLHPFYGPWLSIRAVLLTSARLPETGPLDDYSPCEGCPAPCAEACPGSALPPGGFDWEACRRTTLDHSPCRAKCAARHACVVGREHVYAPELERRYRSAVVRFLEDRAPDR